MRIKRIITDLFSCKALETLQDANLKKKSPRIHELLFSSTLIKIREFVAFFLTQIKMIFLICVNLF
jgi:hypothetical protein